MTESPSGFKVARRGKKTKTRYTGIYQHEHLGGRDITFLVMCRKNGRLIEDKIGKKSEELEECYKRGAATGLADVSNALYESAMSGTPVAQIFYLKNRAPNEWADVQSVNKVQINFSRMSDTQLLNELLRDDSETLHAEPSQPCPIAKMSCLEGRATKEWCLPSQSRSTCWNIR